MSFSFKFNCRSEEKFSFTRSNCMLVFLSRKMTVDATNSDNNLIYVHENSIFFFLVVLLSLSSVIFSRFASFISTETRDRPSEFEQMVLDDDRRLTQCARREKEREENRRCECRARRRRREFSSTIVVSQSVCGFHTLVSSSTQKEETISFPHK